MSTLVERNEDISQIQNGEFIYCKELSKGLIKKDISTLGSVTFESVIAEIEALPLATLKVLGLDSVIFGSNNAGDQRGKILIGKKRELVIEETINNLPTDQKVETFINTLISSENAVSRYFDTEFLADMLASLVNKFSSISDTILIPVLKDFISYNNGILDNSASAGTYCQSIFPTPITKSGFYKFQNLGGGMIVGVTNTNSMDTSWGNGVYSYNAYSTDKEIYSIHIDFENRTVGIAGIKYTTATGSSSYNPSPYLEGTLNFDLPIYLAATKFGSADEWLGQLKPLNTGEDLYQLSLNSGDNYRQYGLIGLDTTNGNFTSFMLNFNSSAFHLDNFIGNVEFVLEFDGNKIIFKDRKRADTTHLWFTTLNVNGVDYPADTSVFTDILPNFMTNEVHTNYFNVPNNGSYTLVLNHIDN